MALAIPTFGQTSPLNLTGNAGRSDPLFPSENRRSFPDPFGLDFDLGSILNPFGDPPSSIGKQPVSMLSNFFLRN